MTPLQELEQRVLRLEGQVKDLTAKLSRLRPPKGPKGAVIAPETTVVECSLCVGHKGYVMQDGRWTECECKMEETRLLNLAHGIG